MSVAIALPSIWARRLAHEGRQPFVASFRMGAMIASGSDAAVNRVPQQWRPGERQVKAKDQMGNGG